MVAMCAQLFWLFYETERWDGTRGENTKGKLFVFSEMVFKIRKFRTCFKMERNPKRKGQQEKKNKIREIHLVINNIYNILSKCFKGLDFTGISYYKHSYMKYSLAFFFFFLCLQHTACGILVPWLGIEPMPPAVEAVLAAGLQGNPTLTLNTNL